MTNLIVQQEAPPQQWSTVSEGGQHDVLRQGVPKVQGDFSEYEITPGEVLETRIEGMGHFDDEYQKEYKGRGTILTLTVHTAKINKSLVGGTYVYFINAGFRRDGFFRQKPGINDWFRIEYEGRDFTRKGNPPHLLTFKCHKTEHSTFIEDDFPNGSQNQGLLLEQQKQQQNNPALQAPATQQQAQLNAPPVQGSTPTFGPPRSQ